MREDELHLIASNYMNNNKQVSHCNKPCWFLQRDEDVRINLIAKHPVANKSHREVTYSHNYVGNNHSSPHRNLGWLLRCGWDCGLDFQHHIVPSIGKSHSAKGIKEVKHCPWSTLSFVTILYIFLNTLFYTSCPSNCRVTVEKCK